MCAILMGMSKDVTFSLDTAAASVILTEMVAPVIKTSAAAIANRARSMASSMTSEPPEITVTESVAVSKRGARAQAIIRATGNDAHANYIGHQALAKAKDAGRV